MSGDWLQPTAFAAFLISRRIPILEARITGFAENLTRFWVPGGLTPCGFIDARRHLPVGMSHFQTCKCLLQVCIRHLPVGKCQMQAGKSLLPVGMSHFQTCKCLL